jgi:WD40 repeat protein
MTDCPTLDELREMLDEKLPADRQATLEEHVNGCDACQGCLESLTASGRVPGIEEVDLTAETFVARVRAVTPATEAITLVPAGPAPIPDVPGYEIFEEVGRGGMGVVYRARHRRLNRPVALKMLTEYGLSDLSVRSRFLLEAEAVAQLHHPHIVQVYEFGEYNGRPYLAMEYVDGGSLWQRLARGTAVPPEQAARLVALLADAVSAAHQKGIIHRDLKPSNILLADEKAAGESDGSSPAAFTLSPKVTDFGIARMGLSELTATGEVLGTPSYMAPEQAAGRSREISTATDVYGLGAILYELLTRVPPHLGENAVETLQKVIHEIPRAPRSLVPGIPRDLDTICRKCLEKEPKKRYRTADALAADLRAHLAGRTISARPAAAWEKALRFARRNPTPTMAMVLIVLIVIGAFQWVDAARRQALEDKREAELATDQKKEALDAKTRALEAARASEMRAKEQAENALKSEKHAQAQADNAEKAKSEAEKKQAETLFLEAFARCENGGIVEGLSRLKQVKELATRLNETALARAADKNATAWSRLLPVSLADLKSPAPSRPVTAATFAPDGQGFSVVTGRAGDGLVRIVPVDGAPNFKPHPDRLPWEISAPEGLHTGVVGLFPDSVNRLYVVYESGHVTEWDLNERKLLSSNKAFDFGTVVRSAGVTGVNSPVSGHLLGAGSEDGRAEVWDLDGKKLLSTAAGSSTVLHFFTGEKKGREVGRKPGPNPGAGPNSVTGILFADSGNMLLTAGEQEGVIMHGITHGKPGRLLAPPPEGQKVLGNPYHLYDLGTEVFGLALDPTRQLFLAGGPGAVSLWNIHDRDRPLWSRPHPDPVTALAFSPDNRICASADLGGNLCCWETLSGSLHCKISLPAPVLAVRFHPSAPNVLVVGCRDGSCSVWRLPEPSPVAIMEPEPHATGPGVIIPVGPKRDSAVSQVGLNVGLAGFWATTPGGLNFWFEIRRTFLPFPDPPAEAQMAATRAAAVSPKGRYAVLSAEGTGTWVCPLTDWDRPRRGFRLSVGTAGVWSCGVRGGNQPNVEWTQRTATHLPTVSARQIGFFSNEKSFFTVSEPNPGETPVFECWEIGNENLITQPVKWPVPNGTVVALDEPRKQVLVGGPDGEARFHEVMTGKHVGPEFSHGQPITAVAVDAKGRWAATGSQKGTVKIWSVVDGKPVGREFIHAGRVTAVAFGAGTSDGIVVTTSSDGTARIWDVETGLPLGPPLRHPGAALCVAYNSRGTFLFTGGSSGWAAVWQVPF